MKVIISHDVDHLYPSDHFLKDLIFPKLWLRSGFEFFRGKISFNTLLNRLVSVFSKRLNRIPEVIDFDKKNGVNSTFFFGMDNVLGMSYSRKRAKKWIQFVQKSGFEVGVHGVEMRDKNKMLSEFNAFRVLSGIVDFGIRMHYVRYDDETFQKLSDIGYLYDTSEFNKEIVGLKHPYSIGNMWEFPLFVMDGYIMNSDLAEAKHKTIDAINNARDMNIPYFTFLFHDYMFNSKTYPSDMVYYQWFVEYCKENELQFISYKEAIKDLKKCEITKI